MKRTKKILTLAMAAVLLVSTTVAVTVAYLTAEDKVINTFTVGDVTIELDEANVNESGEKIDDTRVTDNEYHLLPGESYIKDPTVTVKGDSEDCYVRIQVTVSDIEALKAAFPEWIDATTGVFLLQNLVEGWDNNVWEYESYNPTTATYEFRYANVVAGNANDQILPALFTNVVIPGEVDNDHLEHLNNISISIIAHAIQAIGFDNAADAWAEWE